jgi:nucleotide-binding universal stress UspA family protein
VSLVHVVGEGLPERFAGAVQDRAMAALRDAGEALRGAAAARGCGELEVECVLLSGSPHVEIVRHARARGAELIVLGRHGSRTMRDTVSGTTAERVVRKADLPVLLVAADPLEPYRRALVAVDLSDASRRAADLALALVARDASELRLLHAYHVAFEGWLAEAAAREYRQVIAAEAERRLAGFAELLAAAGVAQSATVQEGDPRAAILREAVRGRAELVVLGTHGRSGVAHALLGSVAEWVMRCAPCDVAVTRPARFTFELP